MKIQKSIFSHIWLQPAPMVQRRCLESRVRSERANDVSTGFVAHLLTDPYAQSWWRRWFLFCLFACVMTMIKLLCICTSIQKKHKRFGRKKEVRQIWQKFRRIIYASRARNRHSFLSPVFSHFCSKHNGSPAKPQSNLACEIERPARMAARLSLLPKEQVTQMWASTVYAKLRLYMKQALSRSFLQHSFN